MRTLTQIVEELFPEPVDVVRAVQAGRAAS